MNLKTISLVLATCLLSAEFAQAQSDQNECPIAVPSDETLGKTFLCNRITVPENWSTRTGSEIEISYVILKSRSLAPFPDPVIYLQGGPGGSALNSISLIASGTEALRANRDVIVIEQRGTAHSNELFCPKNVRVPKPETFEEDLAAADARINEMKINAYSDPEAVYRVIADYAEVIDYRSCVPYLEGQGIDLRQYNTTSTVQDVIRLMQQLDYPAYNLFGGSYGTTVALEIMDFYSQNPALNLPPLRAAVLDGVAPRREFYEQAFIISYVALRVLEGCERDPVCVDAYPNIRQRAVDLISHLGDTPIRQKDQADITVDDLAEVLRAAVTNQTKLVPYLPRLIAELEQEKTEVYKLAQSVARYETVLPDEQVQAAEETPRGLAAVEAQVDSISAQFDAIEESLSLLLLSSGLIQDAILEASTRAELFVAIFENLAELGGGSFGNILVTKLEPFLLHPEQRTRQGLIGFLEVTTAFPTLKSELVALAHRLTEEEVAYVFSRLTNAAFQRGLESIDRITHRVIRCNDDGRGFFNDVAFDAYLDFETPQLIGTAAYWIANYQVSCEQLELAAEAYAPPPPGVVSEVPTLVVNGALDTATPAEWGEKAAETLTNATVATIPMAGHVAGLMTDCGKALVQAFVISPDTPLNLRCIKEAEPRFVLPEDDLASSDGS